MPGNAADAIAAEQTDLHTLYVVLSSLRQLCGEPQMVADLFVNYDCDPHAPPLFERTVQPHQLFHSAPYPLLSLLCASIAYTHAQECLFHLLCPQRQNVASPVFRQDPSSILTGRAEKDGLLKPNPYCHQEAAAPPCCFSGAGLAVAAHGHHRPHGPARRACQQRQWRRWQVCAGTGLECL
eukprot:scaffold112141_cov18-Tisochrysis_lutea.AAC.1